MGDVVPLTATILAFPRCLVCLTNGRLVHPPPCSTAAMTPAATLAPCGTSYLASMSDCAESTTPQLGPLDRVKEVANLWIGADARQLRRSQAASRDPDEPPSSFKIVAGEPSLLAAVTPSRPARWLHHHPLDHPDKPHRHCPSGRFPDGLLR